MTDLALGELEALARKAARGAGLDWGLAEETGRAVRWLAARGLPGAEALAGLLEAMEGQPHARRVPRPGTVWKARGDCLCPLTAGAALSDLARLVDWPLAMEGVARPILVVPFVAQAARLRGTPLRVGWDGACVAVCGEGAAVSASAEALLAPLAPRLGCAVLDGPLPVQPPPLGRAEVPEAVVARLDRFAHRTYAPATLESRLAGAGAGLTDND